MSYAYAVRPAPRRRGLRGLGDCSPPLPGWNPPMCRDNSTGSIVSCNACGGSATPTAQQIVGQIVTAVNNAGLAPGAAPVEQSIPIPGFTGDFTVETLDSWLSDRLQAKESTFVANAIAKGSDSVDAEANDFTAEAQQHCGVYPSSGGCDNQSAVAAKYAQIFRMWASTQSAQVYQAPDSGSLAAPVVPAQQSAAPAPMIPALAPIAQQVQQQAAPPPPPPPAPVVTQPQTTQPATQPSTTPAPSRPVTVTLANLTNPGSINFNIGDAWSITITGPPNTAVSVTASQNSVPLGSTPMGYTDATGLLLLSSSMDTAQAGAWIENWMVGGQALAPISFYVNGTLPAPAGTDPALTSLYNAANANLPALPVTVGPVDATTAWLTSNTIFSAVPNWLTVGGAGLLAWFAFSKGQKTK